MRRLYGAELLSGAGDGIFWVALIATLAGERRFDMLLVCAIVARLGPRALLSVPAGRLVDRSDLVRLIVRTDLVRAALMAGLAATVGLGGDPVLMLVIVLASYVVAVPTRPAMSALLPHLSDETHLASANAMLSTIRQVMTFVGPMFGVGVVAWSTTAAFAANALSFIASALLVQTIPAGLTARSRRRARTGLGVERAPRADVATGTVVRSVPGLDILIALIGAMYFVRGAEMVLHVLVVRDLLEADPASIGYLGAGVGLGALVAAPVARRSAQVERPARPIGLTLVLTAIPTAALVWAERLATATALLVVVGFAMVVFEVVSVVTIQRTVSRSSLGRVFGAVNSSSNAGKLAGAVVAGALAAVIGPTSTLLAVAVAMLAVTVVTVPRLSELGRAAAERRRTLEPFVDVLAGLELFEGAHRIDLERLAAVLSAEDVAAGTTVIHEGAEPKDLFVIRQGEFDVSVAGRPINEMAPGEWFGEIGLVDRVARTATVRARTDATVWRIPGDVFLEVLEESGSPPAALVQGIATRMTRGHG